MAKFRGGRERAPQALRSGAGPVGLSDVVTLLMLAGGTVALAALVDIAGLLAAWSTAATRNGASPSSPPPRSYGCGRSTPSSAW